jgi:23S rRNA pseudouridine1911/1915/1917 synthase
MKAERQHFAWVVGPNEAPRRLDRFLAARGELGTRSQVTRLIAAGGVRVDGRAVKAGTVLRAGQRVDVERALIEPGTIEPEPIALEVLHEDESVLVIDKPPGLVVHPAPGHAGGTLVNALLHRWRTPDPSLDVERLGIVHRLDKDTSGVLVVVKDASALAELGRQFHGREVEKRYLALVWGRPASPRGVIDRPIARHPVDRKRMAVGGRGRTAVTRYELVEDFGPCSLLRLHPETGRTHQIRVHLAAIGHPVLADPAYGRGRPRPAWGLARQALHAESIRFRHPRGGRWITVSAPLPEDMAAAIRGLRRACSAGRAGPAGPA